MRPDLRNAYNLCFKSCPAQLIGCALNTTSCSVAIRLGKRMGYAQRHNTSIATRRDNAAAAVVVVVVSVAAAVTVCRVVRRSGEGCSATVSHNLCRLVSTPRAAPCYKRRAYAKRGGRLNAHLKNIIDRDAVAAAAAANRWRRDTAPETPHAMHTRHDTRPPQSTPEKHVHSDVLLRCCCWVTVRVWCIIYKYTVGHNICVVRRLMCALLLSRRTLQTRARKPARASM